MPNKKRKKTKQKGKEEGYRIDRLALALAIGAVILILLLSFFRGNRPGYDYYPGKWYDDWKIGR